MAEPAPAIQLVRLRKAFGEVVAVDDVDLLIGDGEFFSMLGPSGSGKTTVLRLIAGFEQPTAGAILLHGVDVAGRAPYDRDVNTVFQDYALFPHLTVQQNVEYGLKVKGVGAGERRRRATEMLDTVRLADYGRRKPSQLSGGQRQRVALARALVNQPKVLLLDEPLGALDLKLREEMQVELKSIQRTVGITFVFVTHDQGEALSMSDRVAVFNRGRIEQVGTPREIYERPATEFVANFVGTSNLLPDGRTVRPERVQVLAGLSSGAEGTSGAAGAESVTATIVDLQYLGAEVRVLARTSTGAPLIANVASNELPDVATGQTITMVWPTSAATTPPGISSPNSQGENQA